MNKIVNWFDIPVIDLSRAKRFYEEVLGVEMLMIGIGGWRSAVFPEGGGLVQAEGCIPGTKGPLVYLDANPDLNEGLKKVMPAGGHVISKKAPLPAGNGYYAIIIDSEGNRIGLHSKK